MASVVSRSLSAPHPSLPEMASNLQHARQNNMPVTWRDAANSCVMSFTELMVSFSEKALLRYHSSIASPKPCLQGML